MAEKGREPKSEIPPPPPRQPDPALKGYLERQNDGRSDAIPTGEPRQS